jgi:hypothetical protein
MNVLPMSPNGTDSTLEQVIAREHCAQLWERLESLQTTLQPDGAAIDVVIHDLAKAQLAYAATHGLVGIGPNCSS